MHSNVAKYVRLQTKRTSLSPPWHNGLAFWTSNSKVVGSSPTGGEWVRNSKPLEYIPADLWILL